MLVYRKGDVKKQREEKTPDKILSTILSTGLWKVVLERWTKQTNTGETPVLDIADKKNPPGELGR